jgi:AbrB family looped-hinge helix DNA binding protein
MIVIPMDKAGRLVLPKEVRARLHLVAGDLLEAEIGVNEIRLRPVNVAQAGLASERGRMVWDAPGASATVEEIDRTITRGRTERDARIAGL